jgi:hypothetical protein
VSGVGRERDDDKPSSGEKVADHGEQHSDDRVSEDGVNIAYSDNIATSRSLSKGTWISLAEVVELRLSKQCRLPKSSNSSSSRPLFNSDAEVSSLIAEES